MKRFLNLKILHRSVFLKTLASFILVCISPLLILGVADYYRTSGIVKGQYTQNYIKMTDNVKDSVDRSFESLLTFSVQLSQSPWTKKFIYSRGNSLYETMGITFVQDYITELTIMNSMNELKGDIAIYFNEKDVILSTRGMYNFDTFFSEPFRFESLNKDYWENLLSRENSSTVIMPSKAYTFSKPRNLMAFIQSIPPADRSFKATLIFFIEEESLKNLLKRTIYPTGSSVFVFNEKNEYINGFNTGDSLKEAIAGLIGGCSSGTGILSDSVRPDGKSRNMAFYSVSAVNGWKYVVTVPNEAIMKSMVNMRNFALAIILASLLVGLLLSYKLALKNYKPLAELLTDIYGKVLLPKKPYNDEYRIIKDVIDKAFEYNDQARNDIDIYKPLAKYACFIGLLKNNKGNNTNFLKLLGKMDIKFKGSYFTCISVSFEEDHAAAEDQHTILCSVISLSGPEAYLVNLEPRNKIIILNTESEQMVKPGIDSLKNYFRRQSIRYKAMGVGRTCYGAGSLWESYNESSIALSYCLAEDYGCILHFNEINRSIDTLYYYPSEKQEYIINHIKIGDYEKSMSIAREIIDMNVNNKRLPPRVVKYLFYSLALAAVKATSEINVDVRFSVMPDEIFDLDTVKELTEYVERLYSHACSVIQAKKESHNTGLLFSVLEYLGENYHDSNLTLTGVSEKFSISPSYLSRFIKDQTGSNFNDYLAKLRIKAAKTLLAGPATVLEVAMQVGFTNDITFRRLFKKYEGMTPTCYKSILTT